MLVPICAIGIIDVSDFIDIPFSTVIKPEILASPTISSDTLGSLVPIPRRVLVSPLYIYIYYSQYYSLFQIVHVNLFLFPRVY